MEKAKVNIEMRHTQSNREPFHYTTVIITDAVNRHSIAEVVISKEQFYDLLTGRLSSEPMEGKVIGQRELGYLNQETHTFGRSFQLDGNSLAGIDDPNLRPVLAAWADAMQAKIWAHRWSWSRRRASLVHVTFWRYETGLTEVTAESIRATLEAAAPPEGLK